MKIPSEKTQAFKNFWNAGYPISNSQLIIIPMHLFTKKKKPT